MDETRTIVTRKFLDEMRNPPEYVEERLPTKTSKIFTRTKMGTCIDNSLGDINVGSIAFSGSHYEFSPGSYSLRITRHTLGIGSPGGPGAQLWWKLRHSRLGTIDAFGVAASRGYVERNRSPLEPIYSVGPGTITQYLRSLKGTWRVASSLEGVFS